MGDPKRVRKNYQTPRHPWVGSRIEEERQLHKEYGLRNKTEIWRMSSLLKRFKDRAKHLVALNTTQAQQEQQQLIGRMARLGLIKSTASFDEILGLTIKDLLDRRLQTVLVRKNLARTLKQARQMITHRHIIIGGKVVTSPSYLVTTSEEQNAGFVKRSAFVNEQHPERFSEEELVTKKQHEEAKTKKVEKQEEEVAAYDEKAIEEVEVLVGEKKVESIATPKAASEPIPETKVSEKEAPQKSPTPTKKAGQRVRTAKKKTLAKKAEPAGVEKEASQKKEAPATTTPKGDA